MSRKAKIFSSAAIALSVAMGASAFAADPLKVGWITPLTGAFSVTAVAQTFGLKSEIDRVNAGGGLLGRQLQLIQRDSASDPSKAVSVTNELLFNENVDVMMGPGSSGEAFPMMDIVAGAKKVHITAVQADPLIDPSKRPSAFRAMPATGLLAVRTVLFTNDTLKKKKIAILAELDRLRHCASPICSKPNTSRPAIRLSW